MIAGISGFGFLVQKWPFRDAFFQKTIFIVFLGCTLFLPSQSSKKEILDTHQEKID